MPESQIARRLFVSVFTRAEERGGRNPEEEEEEDLVSLRRLSPYAFEIASNINFGSISFVALLLSLPLSVSLSLSFSGETPR